MENENIDLDKNKVEIKSDSNDLKFDLVRADKDAKWESYLIRCDRPTHIEYLVIYNIALKVYSICGLDGVGLISSENQKKLFSHLDGVREKVFNGGAESTIGFVIEDEVKGKISHVEYLTPE